MKPSKQLISCVIFDELLRSSSDSSGHVDCVADELHAMIDEMAEEEAPSDDSEVAETRSQRIQRYQDSELCEVSDPELWMNPHH